MLKYRFLGSAPKAFDSTDLETGPAIFLSKSSPVMLILLVQGHLGAFQKDLNNYSIRFILPHVGSLRI
jgi:hypothetical protein